MRQCTSAVVIRASRARVHASPGVTLPRNEIQLTDDEAAFLSLLIRIQPATAYQIAKIYDESPVSNFGTSKGKIYPMIRRLKERGALTARALAGDARNSEVLSVTALGRGMVRRWIRCIKPSHLLPKDPLRTMVQSFELLSKDEQLKWIAEVRTGLEAKLVELEEYKDAVHVPFKDQVHDNAVLVVETRLDWLEDLEASIAGKNVRWRGTPTPRRLER